MTRNKALLFLAVLTTAFTAGCLRDESELQREFLARQREIADRRPAQATGACFQARYSATQLEEEIKEFQERYPRKKPESTRFEGHEFTELHPAVADFLRTGRVAGAPAQSSCTTGDCFIRGLQGPAAGTDAAKLESLVAYWYYLKTGTVIATKPGYPWYRDNVIVEQEAKNASAPPLFRAGEAQAWWKAANLLPEAMLQMQAAESLHRIPSEAQPAEWRSGMTCGLSLGSSQKGAVLLDDSCLQINESDPFKTQGALFYPATTHELAHRFAAWSYRRGPSGNLVDLDESEEFLQVSGWRQSQLVTPDGKVAMVWENGLGDYVSSFARISPAEDFAESIAYFRTNPEHVKSIAPRKYEYLRRRVFSGRGYAPADLKKHYAETAQRDVLENAAAVLKACLPASAVTVASGSPVPSPSPVRGRKPTVPGAAPAFVLKPVAVPPLANAQYSAIRDLIQFDPKLESSVRACAANEVANRIAATMARIRQNEPEGCSILDASEKEVASAVASRVGPLLARYLDGKVPVIDYSEVTTKVRERLEQETNPIEAVLQCWRQAQPKACYETALEKQLEGVLGDPLTASRAGNRNSDEREREAFRRLHAYEVEFNHTTRYYEGILSGALRELPARAQAVWEECRDRDDAIDLNTARLSPYDPGSLYVPPAVLHCLNLELVEGEFPHLRLLAGAQHQTAITAEESKEWVDQRILLPRFKALLDPWVGERAKKDQEKLRAAVAGLADPLAEQLILDLSWQRADAPFAFRSCKAEAAKRLYAKLDAKLYPYAAIGPDLEVPGNQACEKARLHLATKYDARNAQSTGRASGEPATPAVATELPSAVLERTPDALYAKVLPLVLETARGRFAQCRQAEYKSPRLKRYCLLAEWVVDDQDQVRKSVWAWTRDRAIRQWLRDPAVVKYRESKGYPERALQDAVQSRVDSDYDAAVDAILKAFDGAGN